MRVTGGRLGGRRLRAPRGDVRPTSDRVREALFMRLGALDGVRVLDLYAGSGALGIEALSRGAAFAVFVERASPVVAVLRANLASLGLRDRAKVLHAVAGKAVGRLARAGERFDLVLLDPPYAAGAEEALAAVARSDLLASGARVVSETSKRHPVPAIDGLVRHDERRYGDTLITQWVREVGRDGEPRPVSSHPSNGGCAPA